jgi:uroporphyrinogen-III synthase
VRTVRLLVTRPQEDGERTAAVLRARGHAVLVAPLLRIVPLAAADLGLGPYAAVLTTSVNAARALAQHARIDELRGLPLYTVGRRSADVARAAGFAAVHSADGDVHDLVALVARRLAGAAAPLLYLAGEDRTADLTEELGRHGLTARTAVIYRAAAAERFPAAAAQAIAAGDLDGVLHYSRRSAAAFVHCSSAASLSEQSLRLTHYCLSAQVAAPLIDAGAATIRLAARPDEEALLERVGSA